MAQRDTYLTDGETIKQETLTEVQEALDAFRDELLQELMQGQFGKQLQERILADLDQQRVLREKKRAQRVKQFLLAKRGKYCNMCGQKVGPNTIYCGNCGVRVVRAITLTDIVELMAVWFGDDAEINHV